jgi:hypothetical protein
VALGRDVPRRILIYDRAKHQRQLLTPEMCAQRLASKLNWWYSADYLTTISGLVAGARDLTNQGRNGVQSNISDRLTYFPSDPMFGGRQSYGQTSNINNRHLAAPASYTYIHQIFSAYYKDGIDNTFDAFNTFTCGTGANGLPRIMGDQGRTTILQSSQYSLTVSKGGRAQSSTVLPLPATVLTAIGNSTFSLQIGGASVFNNRVIQGAFRHVVGASASLSDQEIALIEGVIAWDDGTQNTLIESHPFRNRPPMAGD